MSFEVGDTVILKSGGPVMTVTYVGREGKVDCTWFNKEGGNFSPNSHTFRTDALMQKNP